MVTLTRGCLSVPICTIDPPEHSSDEHGNQFWHSPKGRQINQWLPVVSPEPTNSGTILTPVLIYLLLPADIHAILDVLPPSFGFKDPVMRDPTSNPL